MPIFEIVFCPERKTKKANVLTDKDLRRQLILDCFVANMRL